MKMYYYSFLVGLPKSIRAEWQLQDYKIGAYTLSDAINIKWLRSFGYFPIKQQVIASVREILIFDVVERRGKTVVQYKKIDLISSYRIMLEFQEKRMRGKKVK